MDESTVLALMVLFERKGRTLSFEEVLPFVYFEEDTEEIKAQLREELRIPYAVALTRYRILHLESK